MKTVRRLLYREIAIATAFVMLAFLGFSFFMDFLSVGASSQANVDGAWISLQVCLFWIPNHIYEFMPIAVLIGTIYVLTRMAHASEYTILRTGGLGPARSLVLLSKLGLVFALITFAVGDFVAPWAETQAQLLNAQRRGSLNMARGGAWLRDSERQERDGPSLAAPRHYNVSVQTALSERELRGVRIYEFDAQQRLVARTEASRADIDDDGHWTLHEVSRTHWSSAPRAQPQANETLDTWRWATSLDRRTVAAAVLPLETMSTWALLRYMIHLSEQEQTSQRYEIQFWKKAFYPFACLVMLSLALPFAYLHGRSGGVSYKVFGGVMIGVSFVLVNSIFSHLGLLRNWTPIVAASLPSVLYTLVALGAFAWLVRYR